mgnify:CR=1 FL=1
MSAEGIALAVAVIGLAGGVWMQLVQFKKDAQRIDRVNDVSSDIRKDTIDMKPKIDDIRSVTGETRDCVIKKLEPELTCIMESVHGELKDNIAFLAEDLRFRQRLEKEYKGLRSREMIEGGIRELYEENAVLTIKVQELQKKNVDLIVEKEQYIAENKYLQERIQKLEYQLQPDIHKKRPTI